MGVFKPSDRPSISHLAQIFPEPTQDEKDAMRQDIREVGVRNPVAVWKGDLVDGRTRLSLSQEVGRECPFITLDPKMTEGAVRRWIISENIIRRHLTPSQIAAFHVESRNESVKNESKSGAAENSAASNRELAKDLNIDSRTVDAADIVDKKGAPELKEAMKAGTVSASDAKKIVNKSPAVQRKAVEKVKAGKAKTVSEAVKGKKGKPVPTAYSPFKDIDGACGKVLAMIDRLADKHPAKFHKQAIEAQKHVMQIVKNWWVAVK